MAQLVYVIIVSSCILYVHSFVLLQVRKQNESVSKIDALIHKIIPNDKIDQLKHRFAKRASKTFVDVDKPTDIKKMAPKVTINRANKKLSTDKKTGGKITEERSLESVVLSGVKNMVPQNKASPFVKSISKKILDFVKKNAGPIFRNHEQKNSPKPELIELGGSNPSVMLQLDSKTVSSMIAEALTSDAIQTVVNQFVKAAVDSYRYVREMVPEENVNRFDFDRT